MVGGWEVEEGDGMSREKVGWGGGGRWGVGREAGGRGEGVVGS